MYAKSDLMGLLVIQCSRYDCVTHFHHKKDVNYVLEEVQYLFSVDNDRNESGGSLYLCAIQAFENMIHQLTLHLGISLHISLQSCIDLVSEWCRLHLRRGIIDGKVMHYLFSAVANLLATHPEQAITIISERRVHLLNYAKSSYCTARHIRRNKLNK